MDEKYVLQVIGSLYLEISNRDAFIKELKTIITNKEKEISALRSQQIPVNELNQS
jgi:hypothetical protein